MERIGLEPGTEIGGYRIVSPLGSGAMGAVYKAVDGGGQLVAFKLLHTHVAADAEMRQRLGREIAALQKVHHPGVAHLLDAEADSSEMFIVTGLVDGPTLEAEIADGGPLDAVDLLELADQLRDGLEAVHAAGVIHRDLKPGNVLISDAGPVLIDFGIAHGLEDARVTSAGFVMGTPGYLAPELIDRLDPSTATDWWGWAAMLVYAATGRAPFGVRPLEAVISRARSGDPDTSGLGPLTTAALRGALAADPAARWSPERVVEALRVAAEVGDPPAAPGGTDSTAGTDSTDSTRNPDGTGGAATTVLGAGAAAAAGLGAAAAGVAPAGNAGETEVLDGRSAAEAPFADAANSTHTSVLPVPYAGPAPGSYPPSSPGAAGAADPGTAVYPAVTGNPGAPGGTYPPAPSYPAPQDHYPYSLDNPDPAQHGPGPGFPPPQGYQAPVLRRRPVAVLLLAVPLAVLGATYPGRALVVALVLVVLSRLVGTVHSSFHSRRETRGVRGGDALRAGLRAPWHVVRALVATVPSVLVAASTVLVLGGVVWWALSTQRWVVADDGSGDSAPWVYAVLLGSATAVVLLLLWFGPVTFLVRHGARVVLDGLAPGWVGTLVVAVLAALATWYGVELVLGGHAVDWAPLQEPPSFGQ